MLTMGHMVDCVHVLENIGETFFFLFCFYFIFIVIDREIVSDAVDTSSA